jgi:deazaflavin-dependent oxidoreductase (nitroreductase family)
VGNVTARDRTNAPGLADPGVEGWWGTHRTDEKEVTAMAADRSTSRHRALKATGTALLTYALLEGVAVVIFRLRWTPGMTAIRHFNKRLLNPVMIKAAGRSHWYAAALHHTGRTSGKAYTTPVVIFRTGPDVYIPLPYGTDVDWCRNVLAAGSCTVDDHGTRYEILSPETVPASVAAPAIPARNRRVLELFGVKAYLRGRASTPGTPPDTATRSDAGDR